MPDNLPGDTSTSTFQPPTAADLGGQTPNTNKVAEPTSPTAADSQEPALPVPEMVATEPAPTTLGSADTPPPGTPIPPKEESGLPAKEPKDEEDSKKAKIVGAVLGLVLLLISLPVAFYLVQGRVQFWPKAGEPYPGCEVSKNYSGASTPGYDCKEGSSASVSLNACLPEGCAAQDVSYSKTEAYCDGKEWLNCEGACGANPSTGTIHLEGGQCKTVSVSCTPHDMCGTCQVDIDGYGVRRWLDERCEQPSYKATCEDCAIYDQQWQKIDVDTVQIGQTIYLTTYGSSTHPEGQARIAKARFRVMVDGREVSGWQETTQKNEQGVFYIQYKVETLGDYRIESMIYDPDTGLWK